MTCTPVKRPGGGTAIVCGPRPRRRKCRTCGNSADLLCDWKVSKDRTCDAPICASCTTRPTPDKDICPAHRPALLAWQEAHP